MTTQLNFNIFFSTYLFNPLSNHLSNQDKVISFIGTCLLGVFTAGLFHLGAAIYSNRIKLPSSSLSALVQKTKSTANRILNIFDEKRVFSNQEILSEKFGDLFSCIEPEITRTILQNARKSSEEHLKALLRALNQGNWQDPIFAKPETFQPAALCLLEKGKIDIEQFYTIAIYASVLSCSKQIDIEVVSLFDKEGNLNPQAWDIIKQTNEVPKYSTDYKLTKKQGLVTHKDLKSFFEEMKKHPCSHQQFFFVIKNPEYKINAQLEMESTTENKSITQAIGKDVGVNIFGNFNRDNIAYRMVASFGMMQIFLKAIILDCVKITPIFGLSTLERIENNGLTQTRDMGLPFPGIPFPKRADELECHHAYQFIYHDFYHALLVSAILPRHQKIYIKFAQKIKQFIQKSLSLPKEQKEYLDELYERIIDMEFSHFVDNPQDTKEFREQYFWLSFNLVSSLTQDRIRGKNANNPNFNQYIFDRLLPSLLSQIIPTICKQIKKEDFANLITSEEFDVLPSYASFLWEKKLKPEHSNKLNEKYYKMQHLIMQLAEVFSNKPF